MAEDPPETLSGSTRLGVSVVTCVFNEEQNLPFFLRAILDARSSSFEIGEVIVVASGCTDRSVEILRAAAVRDARVRVVITPRRDGKGSALRLGLSHATEEIVLVENADTVPGDGALEALLSRFQRPEVGLVCTHPVPVDVPDGFAGRLGVALWGVHDQISSLSPKAGEAAAFRRVHPPIEDDVEDDDTFVGMYVGSLGLQTEYAQDAVIYNRVPATILELAQQRFRINRQVLGLRRETGYSSIAWDPMLLVRAVGRYLRRRPRQLPEVIALSVLESGTRMAAVIASTFTHRPLTTWAPIGSTKGAIDTSPRELS
jgi:glycosyltransferase involved in cell wall biosynthesis